MQSPLLQEVVIQPSLYLIIRISILVQLQRRGMLLKVTIQRQPYQGANKLGNGLNAAFYLSRSSEKSIPKLQKFTASTPSGVAA